MQKLVKYILMTVMALCAYLPSVTSTAEAANMLVLPVINNVDYPDVESTYYDNVMDSFKQQDKYEYLDNDAFQANIDKYYVKGQIPTEKVLRDIAESCNADLVMCVSLDKLKYSPVIPARKDDFFLMELKGMTLSYNKETNKFEQRKLNIADELDDGYYVRQNVPLRYWARTVQHEMHRVMGNKKFNLQKQRISKF